MAKKQLTARNSQNEEAKSDVRSQPSVSSVTEGPSNLIDIVKTHMDGSTDNLVGKSPMYIEGSGKTPTLREQQIQAQVNDPELTPLLRDVLDVVETAKVYLFL